MSRLDEIQTLFWQLIVWPTGANDFLAHASPETRASVSRTFKETPSFNRVARLEVYAEAYFYRLLSVLQGLVPVTAWLIGEARFHNLVTDYLLACPSLNPDLRRAGQRFPGFIATHTIRAEAEYLHQVAAIELALCDLLDCADDSVVTQAAASLIRADDWPVLRFRLQKALGVFECGWDFEQLVKLAAAGATAGLARDRSSVCVLVFRKGHSVFHRKLDPGEAAALTAALNGQPFATICDALASAVPNASPNDVAALLERWLSNELIAELLPNNDPRH